MLIQFTAYFSSFRIFFFFMFKKIDGLSSGRENYLRASDFSIILYDVVSLLELKYISEHFHGDSDRLSVPVEK